MMISCSDVVFLAVPLTLSIIVIFFRKRLQREYINYCETHSLYSHFLPFARSKLFLANCWLCGTLLFVMFLVMLAVLIFGTRSPSLN